MSRDLLLSAVHGVNPAIPLCFFCNEPKNQVILAGRLPGDREAPRNAVWDKEPCDKCAELMKQGIMFISVRDGEHGDNPYRTGKVLVIKEEAVRRMGINPAELLEDICRRRCAFIEDKAWSTLGLPNPE